MGAIVQAMAMVEGAGRTMRMSEVEINGGFRSAGPAAPVSPEYQNRLLIWLFCCWPGIFKHKTGGDKKHTAVQLQGNGVL